MFNGPSSRGLDKAVKLGAMAYSASSEPRPYPGPQKWSEYFVRRVGKCVDVWFFKFALGTEIDYRYSPWWDFRCGFWGSDRRFKMSIKAGYLYIFVGNNLWLFRKAKTNK